MIALLVVPLIVFYLFVGVRFVAPRQYTYALERKMYKFSQDWPSLYSSAEYRQRYSKEYRCQAHWEALFVGLAWPVIAPFWIVIALYLNAIDRFRPLTQEEHIEQLNEREQRIASLEKELGIK